MNKPEISQLFAEDGGLSKEIKGFKPRAAQLEMATAVAQAIDGQQQLVVEAGTGTGKTFAYLAPALIANKRTIISTGSKNLQDQLFNRDLPTIKKALKYTGTVALLKGRANYLCLEKMDKLIAQGVWGDKKVLADLQQIRKWNIGTKTGDFSECTALSEDSPIFSQLVSTSESCLGTDCPNYSDCYVAAARKKALNADLVVVNHHLFFADMAVKDTGFGELLPSTEVVIFDEAHQLADIATQYFGESLGSRQLFDIIKDLMIVYQTELKDTKQLESVADNLKKIVQDFRLALGEGNQRGDWREALRRDDVIEVFTTLQEKIEFALKVLKHNAGRSQILDNIYTRLAECSNQLVRLAKTDITGHCYWFETHVRNFTLNITPLSIAGKFGYQLEKRETAWIFTSATLEVGGTFDHFCKRLGIKNSKQLILQSPFDYPKQSMLCVPRFLPTHNNKQTLGILAEILLPVIEANKGRCFMLCTSYFMMRGLAEYFRQHSELNILEQGTTTKGKLLDRFTKEKHSVLVATSSFWEGIDVRGDALSLVIIDKLPFSSPGDPLLKARIDDCRLRKQNPFAEIQIPEAVIGLKQGVGRLIRDVTDKGVVIICDSRLVMQPYGKTFLQSLPPAKRTRDINNVVQFLKDI